MDRRVWHHASLGHLQIDQRVQACVIQFRHIAEGDRLAVNQQAVQWAGLTLDAIESPHARIEDMFERAFARLPEPQEEAAIEKFLATQRQSYEQDDDVELRSWSDLAHVLMNSTEFIFVR